MILFVVIGCGAATPARAAGIGLDAGRPTTLVAWFTELGILDEGRGRWLRLRMPRSDSIWQDAGTYYREHNAMQRLRQGGWKLCWFVRWGAGTWQNGVRPRQHLPLDLREAYERCRHLARAYGGAVDAWEIDNEPDISFVPEQPETYAAFLKACWLGLTAEGAGDSYELGAMSWEWGAGSDEPGAMSSQLKAQSSDRAGMRGERERLRERERWEAGGRRPLVVMAPLALPPGPYFERFVANEGLSYTDGFNFHYYGYAEDFTGMYRQFEDAVRACGARAGSQFWVQGSESRDGGRKTEGGAETDRSKLKPHRSKRFFRGGGTRTLPIFITEFGYGSLGGDERDTVEGREAQMRWFREVTPQIARLGIEAPMAFYLPPYFEHGVFEYGLLRTAARGGRGSGFGVQGLKLKDGTDSYEPGATSSEARNGVQSSKFRAQSSDRAAEIWGEREGSRERERVFTEAWRGRVGQRVDGKEVTPALAWVLDGQAPYRKTRGWRVPAAVRSGVVLDFVDGMGLQASKPRLAHLVTGLAAGTGYRGEGQVVLYNFGTRTVQGRLQASGPWQVAEEPGAIELAPGERKAVRVTVQLPEDDGTAKEARMTWVEEAREAAPAVVAVQFAVEMRNRPWLRQHDFGAAQVDESALARVVGRPKSASEPPLRADAGWAVQPGTRVERTGDTVRFVIEARAPGALRRSVVETPWPAEWGFGGDQWLRLQYRLADDSATDAEAMSVLVRTANGNLYEVWPRQVARKTWRAYLQPAESFTMSFYNPANLPWRLRENRPVALVITFHPNKRPAVFEVRNVQLGRFGKW